MPPDIASAARELNTARSSTKVRASKRIQLWFAAKH
jgi:hypothetical protein